VPAIGRRFAWYDTAQVALNIRSVNGAVGTARIIYSTYFAAVVANFIFAI
jgi:hypothetical protein